MKRYVYANADNVLGKNDSVPTYDEIASGSATYAGLPIIYTPNAHYDACNLNFKIGISDKFFDYSEGIQRHILNHEVAHDYSDRLMQEHTGDWAEFASVFIQEKETDKTCEAYKHGVRSYWEGLYGDIGATALSETITRAITEYLDEPQSLKRRSVKAYEIIDEFVRRINL